MHTTNYINTFILVAEDCPVATGTVPPLRGAKPTVASRQFKLLNEHPYVYTSDQLLFRVHADRMNFPESKWELARKLFFSKGQPCMRASPLTKSYGWGIHSDANGYIAMYGRETDAYRRYSESNDMKCVNAMRNSKK